MWIVDHVVSKKNHEIFSQRESALKKPEYKSTKTKSSKHVEAEEHSPGAGLGSGMKDFKAEMISRYQLSNQHKTWTTRRMLLQQAQKVYQMAKIALEIANHDKQLQQGKMLIKRRQELEASHLAIMIAKASQEAEAKADQVATVSLD
ncbi:hypothetical protein V2J09_021009 [Rumex salicifolius]